jgi:hypothetical protein
MEEANKLEQEYVKTKLDIQTHIALIKTYLNNIQQSKSEIERLGTVLTDLQIQYTQFKEDKDEK